MLHPALAENKNLEVLELLLLRQMRFPQFRLNECKHAKRHLKVPNQFLIYFRTPQLQISLGLQLLFC